MGREGDQDGGGDDGGGWGVGWPHCVDTIVNSLMLGIKEISYDF